MSLLRRAPDDPVRVLDEEGTAVGDVPDLDDRELVAIYREMRLARQFDRRAVNLQRQGRMGTYPPLSGQEAAQVGSVHALSERDWLFPSYREHVAGWIRGLPLDRILRYWMGDERGNRRAEENVFPVAVPIGTQIPHAVGFSWAAKLSGDPTVSLVNFGDGATSEGDFHEGLNFAGVFDTPTVFLCNNNQWAISVPRERQTASETIAQKAGAYGFEGVQVDGMDPLAVYAATTAAVEKARDPDEGESRPTLIEAVMYRFGAHTTADDPTVYRDDAEVERWRKLDPIPRLERFLRETGRLDDERVDAIGAEVEGIVSDAVEAAESTPRPEPGEMFEHVFAEPTPALDAQRAALERLREEHGDATIRRD
ncbi:MAG: pyruvate dehydrogenase (acetyl-transferring) E1 component subunit alpha [Haloferacaceae archaeon]